MSERGERQTLVKCVACFSNMFLQRRRRKKSSGHDSGCKSHRLRDSLIVSDGKTQTHTDPPVPVSSDIERQNPQFIDLFYFLIQPLIRYLCDN